MNSCIHRRRTKTEGQSQRLRRGFTLAELLIVVAIIAVLTAIALPIFTSQLEKSREAADLANVRDAYAEVMIAAVADDRNASYYFQPIYQENDGTYGAVVHLGQKMDGWQLNKETLDIGGIPYSEWVGNGPMAGGNCYITVDPINNKAEIAWDSMIHLSYHTYQSDSVGPGDNPDDVTKANLAIEKQISDEIVDYLNKNFAPGEYSLVTFDVRPDKAYALGGRPNGVVLDWDPIIAQLKSKNLISNTGNVDFNNSDPYYNLGYQIYIEGDQEHGFRETHIYKGVLHEEDKQGIDRGN